MAKQEYRPCPICHGVQSDTCECCKGRGYFPFPWIKSEDNLIKRRWTVDETDLIYSASSGNDAYTRYVHVYGTAERSLSSVYRHWQYVHADTATVHPEWSIAEMAAILVAESARLAVGLYQADYGCMRTIRAIRSKYYELKSSKVCQVV